MRKNLKIISVCQGMKEYINAVRAEINPDKGKLWMRYVIDQYWDQWAAGQFNEERTRREMGYPVEDIEALEEAVNLLEASEIDELLQSAYEKIVKLLPIDDEEKIVCVFANNIIDKSLQGVLGGCIGDSILMQVNPSIAGWEEYVPWVLAHEYNHTVWGYNYYYLKGNQGHDLLTAIITEGEADSFGKAVCPELLPAWLTTLTEEQEKEQWNVLKEYLHLEDSMELHTRFFFGAGAYAPPNTGYRIGFNIVQMYLRAKPESSFMELVEKDAWEILKTSGYDGSSNPSF